MNFYFPESDCKTDHNEPCVFPFIYEGIKYFDCTYAKYQAPWCSTRVDGNDQFIKNKWGICNWKCMQGDLV